MPAGGGVLGAGVVGGSYTGTRPALGGSGSAAGTSSASGSGFLLPDVEPATAVVVGSAARAVVSPGAARATLATGAAGATVAGSARVADVVDSRATVIIE